MKLNVAYPRNGTVKQIEVLDEQLRRVNLTDYRLGNEVDGAIFGEQFQGYTFRLNGGSDKQGFPMVQGVMAASRVALLVKRGAVGFQTFRGKEGERRRKSVRGCIVGPDIALLNVSIVKQGETPIEGITDISMPRRLGPKRANKIRKLFNLAKDDDVKRYVVRRKVEKDGKKCRFKAPKVQRLITPVQKALRARKVKATIAQVRKSAQQRREYLTLISRTRMVNRQRKNALLHRQKVAKTKTDLAAFNKAGAPKAKVAAKKK